MQRANRWKQLLLLVWACALAFGLTFQVSQAEAAHAGCYSGCVRVCKSHGGCDAAVSMGCNCAWACGDGTGGSAICVL